MCSICTLKMSNVGVALAEAIPPLIYNVNRIVIRFTKFPCQVYPCNCFLPVYNVFYVMTHGFEIAEGMAKWVHSEVTTSLIAQDLQFILIFNLWKVTYDIGKNQNLQFWPQYFTQRFVFLAAEKKEARLKIQPGIIKKQIADLTPFLSRTRISKICSFCHRKRFSRVFCNFLLRWGKNT